MPKPSEQPQLSPAVRFVDRRGVRAFGSPLRILSAYRMEDVVPTIAEIERAAEEGHIAAGFVAYEAAPAFDSALVTHAPGAFPLVWFAIYAADNRVDACAQDIEAAVLQWDSECTPTVYRTAVDHIHALIAAGDTYQVNFTFPMHARCPVDAWAFFRSLSASQPTDFGTFIDTGRFAVLSVSPERFFSLDGDAIRCQPMKGTAPRGLGYEDDEAQARALQASQKERAENVMIVDMVRNDLGRIAETGTVRVPALFDTQRLDTCWQMTSTVEARTRAGLPDIFRALFPSASVTGAPKIRTMQIIRELESAPRGVYCGAIGWIGPGRRAEFSVAIRTVTIDREASEATYHVGSGITWDSGPQSEFEECRLKAAVLTHRRPAFDLLESIRWNKGYWLLEGHLDRLRKSALYFGYAFDEAEIRAALDRYARGLGTPAKVRLTMSRRGLVTIDSAPLGEAAIWRVALSPEPVDCSDVFLYHKTTHRAVYDRAQALCPESTDVILWNERRELTESTRANLALRFGDEWFTPPVSSGLLGGVLRAEFLRTEKLRERVLHVPDLDVADEVRLINSVRGWIDVERVHPRPLVGHA